MMMKTEPISILFASDIHFGIRSISQDEMTHAFREIIFPLISTTDIFHINGDLFDTAVVFDHPSFDPIYDLLLELFTLCERYQVILRVMQGTWEHDRSQCKRLETFYKNGGFTFDFRFMGEIELEEITCKNRSLRSFYIPDDLPFSSSGDIVEALSGKMVEKGWTEVDYGHVHGFFDFTFPKGISQERRIVFNNGQFPFVKKMIDVGHVHQHRVCDNTFSNGSFDRSCFGDEDIKGCLRVIDHPDHYVAHFIENTHAAVFDTLTFNSDATTETIREVITGHLNSLKTNRRISLRCIVSKREMKEPVRSWMKETHPQVSCSIKLLEDVSDKPFMAPSSSLITVGEKRIAPTPKTIAAFIRDHIQQDHVLSLEEIETYLEAPDSV
jgi:hypothetical protein